MQLLVAHQILIASGIVLCGLLLLHASLMFARTSAPIELLMIFASLAAAATLSLYLRKVRAKYLAQKHNVTKKY